jgi:hypothetical protein
MDLASNSPSPLSKVQYERVAAKFSWSRLSLVFNQSDLTTTDVAAGGILSRTNSILTIVVKIARVDPPLLIHNYSQSDVLLTIRAKAVRDHS